MDFVAIDFETATSNYTSVCSLGICVVENNKITDRKEKSEQGSTKNVEADIFNFELCIAAERV